MFCTVSNCDRNVYSRDLCEMHYRRWLRNGDAETLLRAPGRQTCIVHGCRKAVDARGLCHGHYQRLLRSSNKADDEPLDRRRWDPICSVETCGRPMYSGGLCKTHKTRLQKFGDVLVDKPIKARTGKGGLSHGYRKVPVPKELRHLTNGQTPYLEHRLVMAAHLGRALRTDESVHHKNGDRTDNRIENLELWSRWQPRGQRMADKIAFAKEILRTHGAEETGS